MMPSLLMYRVFPLRFSVLLCVVDQRLFLQQNENSKNPLHLVQCAVPSECVWNDKWLADDGRDLRSKGLDESHRGKIINESSLIHKTGTWFFVFPLFFKLTKVLFSHVSKFYRLQNN